MEGLRVQHRPGWGEDQAEDAVRLLGQLLQDRQHERRRLSAASLGAAHAVTAWEGRKQEAAFARKVSSSVKVSWC